MRLEEWRPRRLVAVWALCGFLTAVFMVSGTMFDAGGDATLGALMFFLASACIAAPLILTWHWRKSRRDR